MFQISEWRGKYAFSTAINSIKRWRMVWFDFMESGHSIWAKLNSWRQIRAVPESGKFASAKFTTEERSKWFFLPSLLSIRSVVEKSISFFSKLRFSSIFVEFDEIGENSGEKSGKFKFDLFSLKGKVFSCFRCFVFGVYLHGTFKPHKLKLSHQWDFEAYKLFCLNVFSIGMTR